MLPAIRSSLMSFAFSKGSSRVFTVGALALAVLVVFLVGVSLWQQRLDARNIATQHAENLRNLLSQEIIGRFRTIDAMLNEIVTNVSDPQIDALSKMNLIFRTKGLVDNIDSVLVTDTDGQTIFKTSLTNLDTRLSSELLAIHRQLSPYSTQISQPYDIRPGAPVITFSRRISDTRFGFAGVAAVNLKLAYFRDVFSRADVGANGIVLLTMRNGRVVARLPATDGKLDTGRDLSSNENFQRSRRDGTGTFIARSATDGIERLFAFAPISGGEMMLTVGLAIPTIYREWNKRASIIGGATLVTALALVVMGFFLSAEFRRRAEAEAELETLARVDALTGLANRRHFDFSMQREWRRAARTGATLSLLLIDADHFKAVNDRFGHVAGDEVLRLLADVIGQSIRRPGDIAARYGGEEFAVILPDTGLEGAMAIARNVQAKLAAAQATEQQGRPRITVSVGVAAATPAAGDSIEDFVKSADQGLYQAKHEGRNIVRAEPPRIVG
jgi:diguanylate cyclase (GGDEF)-like protein